jgi:NADPH2:quinone reductase
MLDGEVVVVRAVQVVRLDGPAAVEVRDDVPPPVRAADQVLVEVRAAGVTFPDVLQTKGLYQFKPELPFTLGTEVAGVVREAPDGSGLRTGDRVAGFSETGAFAELVALPADRVVPLPDEVGFRAGACLPMNYFTAHFALVVRGQLREGQTVLVHGAAGGVGTAVTQLASAMGARVIAVVSTAAKGDLARKAGAAETVSADEFRGKVSELTGGAGVDLVVDPVGGDRFTDSLRSLRPTGKLLVLGFTAGDIPTVKVNRLLLNNIDVVGVGWGHHALTLPGYLAGQWADLLPHLRSGRLDPLITAVHPLDKVADALTSIDQRQATGKVVIDV